MTQTIKAVLLSALLFPGAGQILLKRYVTGLALAGTALIALSVLIYRAIQDAEAIAAQILQGKIAPDTNAIIDALAQQRQHADSSMATLCTQLLIASWIISIAHAWWTARQPHTRR